MLQKHIDNRNNSSMLMRQAGAKGVSCRWDEERMSAHPNEHKLLRCTCLAGHNLLLSVPAVNMTVE